MNRLLTTEQVAKSWAMSPGVALSILTEIGVKPFPFGRGRGRGDRWDASEVQAALEEWRAGQFKKAPKNPRRSKSAENFFSKPYAEAQTDMRDKQPRQ